MRWLGGLRDPKRPAAWVPRPVHAPFSLFYCRVLTEGMQAASGVDRETILIIQAATYQHGSNSVDYFMEIRHIYKARFGGPMPDITLSMEEERIKAGRSYAAQHNTSLNELIRDVLQKTAENHGAQWRDECFALMDELKIDSKGKVWRREDVYRGEMLKS
jgi:hypothetical protein